jgi:hypothetical protein
VPKLLRLYAIALHYFTIIAIIGNPDSRESLGSVGTPEANKNKIIAYEFNLTSTAINSD